MQDLLSFLSQTLEKRLSAMDALIKRGLIPGELDSYELHQMVGRAKELECLIVLLKDYNA